MDPSDVFGITPLPPGPVLERFARVASLRLGGARMKPRNLAVPALVVWYLIRPPLPHLNANAIRTAAAPSLSRWIVVRTFPTEEECEAQGRARRWERCIASDDPGFNGR